MKFYIFFAVVVCLFLGQLGYAVVDCQQNAVIQSQDLPSVTWLSEDPNEPDPNKVPE